MAASSSAREDGGRGHGRDGCEAAMTRSRALLLLWLAAAMLGAGALALLVPGGPG